MSPLDSTRPAPLRSDPELMRKYKREWIAKRRADWLAANGPCVRCGSWENLEVDHIDRTQKVDHKVWSWSEERRDAELAKCQVLCRECHLEKGREVGDQPPARHHGTDSMYARGCRCDDCRHAHTTYQVAWRRRRREKHGPVAHLGERRSGRA